MKPRSSIECSWVVYPQRGCAGKSIQSEDWSLNERNDLRVWKDNLHRTLKNKGIIDSGCSRHMTGNKAYLADFQDFNGGPVAFGGSKGYITGKGKIKTVLILPQTISSKSDNKGGWSERMKKVFFGYLARLHKARRDANVEVKLSGRILNRTKNLSIQMDVKSAFLYGKIDEEVYVSQPPGFLDSKYPEKVYKVVLKSLYGYIKLHRAWSMIGSLNSDYAREILTAKSTNRRLAISWQGESYVEMQKANQCGHLFQSNGFEAVDKVNSIIAPTLIGNDPTEHTKINNFMVQELDETVNEWVGASRSCQICYLYMQQIANFAGNKTLVLPIPAFNVINRGSHTGNKLAMQEFIILPVGASYFRWVLPYSMKDIQYDNAKFKKR
ncbi:enolase [Tanacetum coccineum]